MSKEKVTLSSVSKSMLVSMAAGLLVRVLVALLQWMGLNDTLYLLGASVTIVLLVLLLYARRTSQRRVFWVIAASILLISVFILYGTTVMVPQVEGLALPDARSAVVRAGLETLEKEITKGGSDSVVQQSPVAGTRMFRGSSVTLVYGELPKIRITAPLPDTEVSQFSTVSGICEGMQGSRVLRVYVLVRPRDSHVWVQAEPTLDNDGAFRVTAQFGDLVEGVGEELEVMAIVTVDALKEGDFGTTLPKYVSISEIVKVKRSR